MGLNFIFGGAGYGKTEACLRRLTEMSEKHKTLIYIVPEQFTLESEKSLCQRANDGAIMSVQVLSFQRLAYRLFAESGTGIGVILDDAAKNMLLRKITLELSQELPFFGKAADKQGFIENLRLIIREFFQYNISILKLEKTIEEVAENESLYRKLSDIFAIYKRYVNYIENAYISAEQTLTLVPEKVLGSKLLEGAHIFIDGFNGFTPQEYNIIETLMKKAVSLTVTLTVKSNKTYHNEIKPQEPFFETKTTVNKLTNIARENGIQINEPVYLMDSYRFENFPELSFLEKNFFHYHYSRYEKNTENIRIYETQNHYAEIEQAAVNILRLTREHSLKYKDIAVVCADSSTYEHAIKDIFKTYEIPFFIDTKADILSHPLSELIRGVIDIAAYNFSYEPVFRFLKTGLSSLSADEVDMLENYVLAFGLKGFKWNLDEWTYGFDSGVYDKEIINLLRDKVLKDIEPFLKVCEKNKNSIRNYSVAVFNLLFGLNVNEKLDKMAASEVMDSNALKRHEQIYGKTVQVFNKLVEILGDEQITVKSFGKIVEEGFSATDTGIIPPTLDQVIIGDLERSRLPEIKALLLIGVNEGVLPAIKKEIGLLGDEERVLLKNKGVELAPDSRRKSYEEQFLIYSVISKPLNYLYLSYPAGNLQGKALRPSSLIAKVKKLFPEIEVGAENNEVTLAKPMLSKIGVYLQKAATGDNLTELEYTVYSWFSQSKNHFQMLDKMEKIRFELTPEIYLNDISINSLYSKRITTGISRLEQYIKCPFAYFIKYNLNANERQLYEATPIDYGNFFHNVLELFSNFLDERGLAWKNLNKETIGDIVDISVEALAPQLSNAVYLSTAKFRYMVKRIARISKRSIWALVEHIKNGLFEPKGYELSFGMDSPITSISVAINDEKRFILTGRVDRVDAVDIDGNVYIKIIDYKSGNVTFDISDVYFGMQLQLIMYLDALLENGAKYFGIDNINISILPGGVFYFNIKEPMLNVKEKITPDALEEMMLKTFKMTGLVLKDEKVVKAMDSGIDGYSGIIQASVKKDGTIGSGNSTASLENFDLIRKHVLGKITSIGQEMISGKMSVNPFKKGDRTACDFCGYNAICKKEIMESKSIYNIVNKVSIEDFGGNHE